MAVSNALDQLRHEPLDDILAEKEAFRNGLHVFLEVQVEELEDEVEFLAVGVDDVEELDDIGVRHFFEEGDFADGGGGDAFVFGFEADLFEGHDAVVVAEVFGAVDDAVGACGVWGGGRGQRGWKGWGGWGGWGCKVPSPIFSIFW